MQLATLRGTRGAVIPGYRDIDRETTNAIVARLARELYPCSGYSVALRSLAARPDAARLIQEAAEQYCSAPAPAPAPAPATTIARARRAHPTRTV